MQKGFTLLEMLIALFIISLLLTLALPAWQQHSQQTILQKEQQKLYVFLRQIQARVENSTDIWLLLANRDPVGKRWCLTAQIKNSHLCDCLNPVACPQNVSAHFYYPAFAETVLVSKRYYPLEFTRLTNGAMCNEKVRWKFISVFKPSKLPKISINAVFSGCLVNHRCSKIKFVFR